MNFAISHRRIHIALLLAGFTISTSCIAQTNTFLGYKTGDSNTAGHSNVMVGAQAGEMNTGFGNIFIGTNAGREDTTNNKLYISNNDTAATIYGELNTKRIAIGTTDLPTDQSYKLTVEGKIIAREMKVTQLEPWPDYVFTADYTLLNLYALDKFIAENSHLPDIPSAEDVAQEGVLLGEMQTKLLLKIEELTLYTIQQQKQIDALALRIQKLENE